MGVVYVVLPPGCVTSRFGSLDLSDRRVDLLVPVLRRPPWASYLERRPFGV